MLTLRKQQILQIIVDEHIGNPVPVSSEGVVHKLPVTVSSATIRNDMAELEEDGYLARPYTSAGGVPSDKAYRVYVESLGNVEAPTPLVQEFIRREFQQAQLDMDAWSRVAVQLLAGLVHTMAMATPPRAIEARWKHLNLVHVQELLALLIIVYQESRLKQQLVPLKEPTTQDELTNISNKLNTMFSGLSFKEISAKAIELSPVEEDITGAAIKLFKAEEDEQSIPHYVDGMRHIFSYPELSIGSRAREIAELLEDQRMMRSILGQVSDTGVVHVTIGAENKMDLLRPFSIVFAAYGIPLQTTGVVGIIGPTRMEYATAISSVKYFSSIMSEMVEGVHRKAS